MRRVICDIAYAICHIAYAICHRRYAICHIPHDYAYSHGASDLARQSVDNKPGLFANKASLQTWTDQSLCVGLLCKYRLTNVSCLHLGATAYALAPMKTNALAPMKTYALAPMKPYALAPMKTYVLAPMKPTLQGV